MLSVLTTSILIFAIIVVTLMLLGAVSQWAKVSSGKEETIPEEFRNLPAGKIAFVLLFVDILLIVTLFS